MAGLYDLLIKNAAGQNLSRTAPPAPSIDDARPTKALMTPDEVSLATATEGQLGLEAGWEQTKGMAKGAIAAAAEFVGGQKFGQSMRQGANANMAEAQRISSHSIAPQSLKDVGGVSDFLDYAKFGVARQVPQFGAMALGAVGGGAGVMAAASGLNIGAQYLEGNAEIDELRAQNVVTPEREAQLRQQVLEKSGLAGIAMGFLDRLGFGAVAPRLVGGVVKSLPKQVIKAMGTEGATEAVQEYIGMTATKLALEKPEAYGLTKDEVWRLADAGVLGGLTGGAFAVPGATFSNAGQMLDKGVELAAAGKDKAQELYGRFRPGDDAAAAAGGVPPPGGPAGPSAGTRMGMALRGLVDTDPEVIKQAVGEQIDALMKNEYVARAVEEGTDFLSELRKSTRLNKIGAFENQVRDGFKQFLAGYEAGAETDNIEAMYARYKEMLSRVGPDFSGVTPRKAGAAAGAAVAGFNDWLGRTDAAAASIFEGAKEGFQNPGEKRTTFGPKGSAFETAASVGEAGAAVVDTAKAAAELTKDAAEIAGRYAKRAAKAGAEMTREAYAAAREAMRSELNPVEGEAAATVDEIAALFPPDYASKKEVVARNDTRIIEDTLRQLGAKDSDAVRVVARKMAPLLNTGMAPRPGEQAGTQRASDLVTFLSSPQAVSAFQNSIGVLPHQFLAYLFLNLRANGLDTEAESLGYMGTPPPDELVNPQVAEDTAPAMSDDTEQTIDEYEDAGMTVSPEITDPGERSVEQFRQMLLTPEQTDRANNNKLRGTQWVLLTRATKDPATGEVLEQKTTQKRVNMTNIAKSQVGTRRREDGVTNQQRNDRNFFEGMSQLFTPWTTSDEIQAGVDEAGNPIMKPVNIEWSVQPARQVTRGKQVTALPIEDLDGWLRDDSAIGFDQEAKKPRTFADANAPSTAPDGLQYRLEKLFQAEDKAAEAEGADRLFWENKREARLKQIGKEALSPWFDLRDKLPEENLRAIVDDALEYVQRAQVNPAVDEAWDEMLMERTPEQIAAFKQSLQSDNLVSALRALPTEVLDAASTLLTRQLHSFIDTRFNTQKEKTNPDDFFVPKMEYKDASEEETGVLTQDMSGELIDHGSAVDRELRGKHKAAAEKRRSVVSSERVAARAEPPPNNQAAWLANPELLRGVQISQEVRVEETGETVTMTEDAADALIALNQRESALQRLLGCV